MPAEWMKARMEMLQEIAEVQASASNSLSGRLGHAKPGPLLTTDAANRNLDSFCVTCMQARPEPLSGCPDCTLCQAGHDTNATVPKTVCSPRGSA